MKLFYYIILLFTTNTLIRGATSIGTESSVTTPVSAHYSAGINVRPGMNEVVTYNPPIFSWFYNTNSYNGAGVSPQNHSSYYQTNAFTFQISSNSTFTGTLLVDVDTSFNFYNFLPVLSTNHGFQFWWRVVYRTAGAAFFTNNYTFNLSTNFTNWDRSLLATTNYYYTNATKRFFGYNLGEEAAIWQYALTNDALDYYNITNYASETTNQTWWKNGVLWGTNTFPIPTSAVVPVTDGITRAQRIGSVLFLYKFSGDNRWTNSEMRGWLITNLYHNTHWLLNPSNNYCKQDYGDGQSPEPIRLALATYSWLYDDLGTNLATFPGIVRSNAYQVMIYTTRFMTAMDFRFPNRFPLGQFVYYFDWGYFPFYTNTVTSSTNLFCVPGESMVKNDSSHLGLDRDFTAPLCLFDRDNNPEISFHRQLILNYYLARSSGWNGFASSHLGAYGYTDGQMTIQSRSKYSLMMLINTAYPELQIRRNDFSTRFAEWYTRMLPYGKRMEHGAYGDGRPNGLAGYFLGIKNRGFDLAAVSAGDGGGYAAQLFNLNSEYFSIGEGVSHWDLIPARYHYPIPAPKTNTTSAVYLEDGMVVASSISPSLFDCYTNGLGWSIKASPRGNHVNHGVVDMLSMDMWAYGAQLTDSGGASLDPYAYRPAANNGLFVNGLGASFNTENGLDAPRLGYSQLEPLEASIINFTNYGINFVYAAADATPCFTNTYHPEKNNVTKVRRHILFPRSKYWIIYDEFASVTPSTFMFRWHIPWCHRYESGGSALANEVVHSGWAGFLNIYGSNSLSLTTNGFNYTAGNAANSSYPNPPRVVIHSVIVNNTNQWGLFAATGTNYLQVGTNAVGSAFTNSSYNPFTGFTYITTPPDRAAGIWITNKIASTNFSLMTVLIPQKPGVSAPVITRLSDNTVVVTYDGVVETNTFDSTYTGPFSYKINTVESITNNTTTVSVVTGVRLNVGKFSNK